MTISPLQYSYSRINRHLAIAFDDNEFPSPAKGYRKLDTHTKAQKPTCGERNNGERATAGASEAEDFDDKIKCSRLLCGATDLAGCANSLSYLQRPMLSKSTDRL